MDGNHKALSLWTDKERFSQSSKSINYRITAGHRTHLDSPFSPGALWGFLGSEVHTCSLDNTYCFIMGTGRTQKKLDSSLTIFGFLFFKDVFIIYFMCVSVLSVCVPCARIARGSQERGSDRLELELQMVVNHCVGAQSWARALCKNSQCCATAAAPPFCFAIKHVLFLKVWGCGTVSRVLA